MDSPERLEPIEEAPKPIEPGEEDPPSKPTLEEKIADVVRRAPAPTLPPEALGGWATIQYRPWLPAAQILVSGFGPENGQVVTVEVTPSPELRALLDALVAQARSQVARQAEVAERSRWLAGELALVIADEEL